MPPLPDLVEAGEGGYWIFWCPGCNSPHAFDKRWTFVNNDRTSPSFQPSIVLYDDPVKRTTKCHLVMTDGKICFCADSKHALAGQTVPMEPIDGWGTR